MPLVGCGRAASRETLRFWAMGREGEVAHELLAGFRAEHPNIELRIEQLPWTAAHEKLLTAFAGDATPDVAQLGNTWLPELVALNAIEPLDDRVAASPDIGRADYFDGIWDTNRIDGRLYGLPWYVDTRLLFYRRDLLARAGFEAPPSSWDEWLAMQLAIKRLVGPGRYAVLLPLNEYDPLVALALQQDEPLLRDGGRYGNFRSEGFRRTWRYFLSMFERGLAPPASNNEIANVWNEFGRGYFSFYISGPWQIGEFRRRLPAELQPSWATAPLPGPTGPGASIAGGSSLALFRRARRKEAAWALVRYLSRPAVQQRFYTLTGNLPPRRTSWEAPALAGDAKVRAFADQLERVRPVPQVPEWERIATELRLVTERVVRGDIAADLALAELDARADRILEKRRWMLERSP
ncbi:sugar ABC transporter substrate-binding protein [Ideonella sp.]|uniref:sugar ABC transporter substrate-binding protein n=1 Tax=Ideonella sp. TaxID=1929293 RepID=UPI002B491F4B|nr:sugar ABC transporter substrate-binding protein [Ideonella sp.]HJV71714.1 sugar ABC transporter substrate-binding protein [Ideonella sp.]